MIGSVILRVCLLLTELMFFSLVDCITNLTLPCFSMRNKVGREF